jgi:hypothetical protein
MTRQCVLEYVVLRAPHRLKIEPLGRVDALKLVEFIPGNLCETRFVLIECATDARLARAYNRVHGTNHRLATVQLWDKFD